MYPLPISSDFQPAKATGNNRGLFRSRLSIYRTKNKRATVRDKTNAEYYMRLEQRDVANHRLHEARRRRQRMVGTSYTQTTHMTTRRHASIIHFNSRPNAIMKTQFLSNHESPVDCVHVHCLTRRKRAAIFSKFGQWTLQFIRGRVFNFISPSCQHE